MKGKERDFYVFNKDERKSYSDYFLNFDGKTYRKEN